MGRRFKLQVLHKYNVKFSKLRNFTLDTLRLDKLKSTGGRLTNIPWIYSSRLYHCAIGTHACSDSRIFNKYKYFLPHLTFCVIFHANKYKVAENALRHMLLKLIIDRV
jgi:hypothetical protein